MSEYAYKPRLGFDIRINPPRPGRQKAPAWAAGHTRLCDAPGCQRTAAVRAAKSPREPDRKIWLCTEHAREHNLGWNWFEGLSDAEAEAVRLAQIYGERPTWSLGRNDRARASTRARGPADMADAFGIFREAASRQREATAGMRDGRKLPRLQAQAFATLGLAVTAPGGEIRRRYAELVRRYHPDANGGDRSAEAQLGEVVRAHQILKKAGIC
jgi:hypothetical protein